MTDRLVHYDGRRPQAHAANLVVNVQTSDVGIGTQTPIAKLHVEGNIYVTSNVTFTDPLAIQRPTGNVLVHTATGEVITSNAMNFDQGNVNATNVTVTTLGFDGGGGSGPVSSLTLQDVTEQGASTDRTVTFSNVTTAFTTTANVVIGTTCTINESGTAVTISRGSSGVSVDASANELFIEDNTNCGLTIACPESSVGSIHFSNPGAPLAGRIRYIHASNTMIFHTNNENGGWLFLDKQGQLGVNQSAPEHALHVGNDAMVANTSTNFVGIGTASPTVPLSVYHPTNNTVLLLQSGDPNVNIAFEDDTTTNKPILQCTGNDLIMGHVAGGNRVVLTDTSNLSVDSSTFFVDGVNDKVGIGNTTPASPLTVEYTGAGTSTIRVDSDENAILATRYRNGIGADNGCEIIIQTSNTNSGVRDIGPLQSGDAVGDIQWKGASDSGTFQPMGRIKVVSKTGVTPSDAASEMRFYTTNNSEGNVTQRMVIDEGGRVGIGTTDPLRMLHITENGGSSTKIAIENTSNSTTTDGSSAISFRNTSSGTGTTTFKECGYIGMDVVTNDDATFTNEMNLWNMVNGTLKNTLKLDQYGNVYCNDGLLVKFPTNRLRGAVFGNVDGTQNETLVVSTYNNNTTDNLNNLVPGSNFGGIIAGGQNGHLILALRNNDTDDSVSIVSNVANDASGTYYDRMVGRFKSSGDVHFPSGSVGIGTDTPDAILETSRAVSGLHTGALLTNTNQAGTADAVSLNIGLGRTPDTFIFKIPAMKFGKENQWLGTPSTVNGYLSFSTISAETISEKMRITSGGSVGIGTDTPGRTLHVSSGTGQGIAAFQNDVCGLVVQANGGGANQVEVVGYRQTPTGYSNVLIRANASDSTGIFLKQGNEPFIGIGTNTPEKCQLHVVRKVLTDGNILMDGDSSISGNPKILFRDTYTSREGFIGFNDTANTFSLKSTIDFTPVGSDGNGIKSIQVQSNQFQYTGGTGTSLNIFRVTKGAVTGGSSYSSLSGHLKVVGFIRYSPTYYICSYVYSADIDLIQSGGGIITLYTRNANLNRIASNPGGIDVTAVSISLVSPTAVTADISVTLTVTGTASAGPFDSTSYLRSEVSGLCSAQDTNQLYTITPL